MFNVSAQAILGSSKVLGQLPRSVHRFLGVGELSPSPRYIVVAGPTAPSAVLLVENPTSFETAVQLRLDKELTLVAAYGYGLNTRSDSSAGLALLDSVAHGRCQVLSRSGNGHDLSSLFGHRNLFFWGDLDREGLRIALAIRKRLPALTLSALYAPMREMVAVRESSHPYSDMSGKTLQAPWSGTGDELFDGLAAACQDRAVDQEALDLGAFGALAAVKLDHPS
jgi:hypothetical protein